MIGGWYQDNPIYFLQSIANYQSMLYDWITWKVVGFSSKCLKILEYSFQDMFFIDETI